MAAINIPTWYRETYCWYCSERAAVHLRTTVPLNSASNRPTTGMVGYFSRLTKAVSFPILAHHALRFWKSGQAISILPGHTGRQPRDQMQAPCIRSPILSRKTSWLNTCFQKTVSERRGRPIEADAVHDCSRNTPPFFRQ